MIYILLFLSLGSYLNIKRAGENIDHENSNTNNVENEYEKIAKIAEEINVIKLIHIIT